MSAESQFEREELDIENRLHSGEISNKEYNQEMRELARDYRDCAENAAQEAFHDEMNRW